MAEVRVEGICKSFGSVQALRRVDCAFEDGQLTVLVGPSGCGKTTLLRMIAGLEEPTDGAILVGGQDISDAPPWERNVAMVFQSYALYPHMTVFRNIAFPLEAAKVGKDEIRRRVDQTAKILQIEDLLQRKPRELSGGQMQRVALGRAIVREPDVFLMDEPLSNLDAKLRVLMRAELKHLQAELGVTTIYVTHDQAEAMTLADKLIVMNAGCIQQVGRPDHVYRRPQNKFVAGFIGSPPMNFLDCCYDVDHTALVGDGFLLPVGPAWQDRLSGKDGAKLILGVRPENMQIVAEPTPTSMKAAVYVTEQMGREILLNAKVGATMVRAYAPATAELQAGLQVWLHSDDAAVHVFDGVSEETLLA